jgi:hypothetical protein
MPRLPVKGYVKSDQIRGKILPSNLKNSNMGAMFPMSNSEVATRQITIVNVTGVLIAASPKIDVFRFIAIHLYYG